jgi:hypothetical protein
MWAQKRIPLAAPFTRDGMVGFIETHNALSRKMISLFDRKDPEFFSALLELAQNCSTLVSGGKIFVDKVDRTNS